MTRYNITSIKSKDLENALRHALNTEEPNIEIIDTILKVASAKYDLVHNLEYRNDIETNYDAIKSFSDKFPNTNILNLDENLHSIIASQKPSAENKNKVVKHLRSKLVEAGKDLIKSQTINNEINKLIKNINAHPSEERLTALDKLLNFAQNSVFSIKDSISESKYKVPDTEQDSHANKYNQAVKIAKESEANNSYNLLLDNRVKNTKDLQYELVLKYAEENNLKDAYKSIFKHHIKDRDLDYICAELSRDMLSIRDKNFRLEFTLEILDEVRHRVGIDEELKKEIKTAINLSFAKAVEKGDVYSMQMLRGHITDKEHLIKSAFKAAIEKGDANILNALFTDNNNKKYIPSSKSLTESIDNSTKQLLDKESIESLVKHGVDANILKDNEKLKRDDKQKIIKIAKEFKNASKDEINSSKLEALELIKKIRIENEDIKDHNYVTYSLSVYIDTLKEEHKLNKESKLTKEAFNKIVDITKDELIKNPNQDDRNIFKRIIDQFKDLFKLGQKSEISSSKKQAYKGIKEDDLKSIKSKVRSALNDKAQTDLNTSNIKKKTIKDKGRE
ncbi:MAG: hypothetical protein ACK4OM_05490 [Alphaproteobacteria bacterium]